MAEHYDAVVIGGGPAGSIAALLLARLGWRIALVERRHRGMGKTCGHCLSARAQSILAKIGLENIIREVAAGKTDTMLAYTPNTPQRPAHFPAPAMITPRDQLDHRLIDAAQAHGVDIFQPVIARITHPGTNRQHSTIMLRSGDKEKTQTHTIETGLVIGADGLRSRAAAAFTLNGARSSGRKYGFSFQCPAIAVPGLSRDTIHMFLTPHGYLGVIEQDNGTRHCAALVQDRHHDDARHPRAFLDAAIRSFSWLRSLNDSPSSIIAAGPMHWRPERVADVGVALVGDAAGYIEPFTGEGMTWAIQSAMTLAAACRPIPPGRWTSREAMRYEVIHRQQVIRRQRICRWLSLGLERRWVWQPLLRSSAISSFLGRHAAARLQSA